MYTKASFKLMIVVCIMALELSSPLYGQIKFNSEKIKQIYALVPDPIKNEIAQKSNYKTGTYFLPTNLFGEKKLLIVRINKYNELDHLGFFMINDRQNATTLRVVYDFVERAFLYSALLKEKYLLDQEMFESGIEILFNGGNVKMQNPLSVIPKIAIDQNTPLNVKFDSDNFLLLWKLENANTLLLKIPNNYSMIAGKTKDELEKDLLRDIRTSKISETDKIRPPKNQLKRSGQDIFVFQGEIYSTTPELSTSKYFFVNDSIYPVFTSRFYKESIRNLFLNLVPSTLELDITQKLYGGIDEKYKLNINNFLTYFQSDYNIYFGWQSSEKENLKATIYLSSKVYNFNHMLVVTPKIKTVFRENEMTEGLFFAYIPRENNKNQKE